MNDLETEDWENVLWFLLANNLRISNAHEKRLKELKSTIETMDAELAALANSFIALYKKKRDFADGFTAAGKEAGLAADPKWQLLCRELDRAEEHFKQRVKSMG